MKPYTSLYCSMLIGLLDKQGGLSSYSSVSHSVDEKDQADYNWVSFNWNECPERKELIECINKGFMNFHTHHTCCFYQESRKGQ